MPHAADVVTSMRRSFAVLFTSEPVHQNVPLRVSTAVARATRRHGSVGSRHATSMLHAPDAATAFAPFADVASSTLPDASFAPGVAHCAGASGSSSFAATSPPTARYPCPTCAISIETSPASAAGTFSSTTASLPRTTGVQSWPCASSSAFVNGPRVSLPSVLRTTSVAPSGRWKREKPKFSDTASGAVTRQRQVREPSFVSSQVPAFAGVTATRFATANRGGAPASASAASSRASAARSSGWRSSCRPGDRANAFVAQSASSNPE